MSDAVIERAKAMSSVKFLCPFALYKHSIVKVEWDQRVFTHHHYYSSNNLKLVAAACDICELYDGYLTTINGKYEYDFLESHANQTTPVWIGLHRTCDTCNKWNCV